MLATITQALLTNPKARSHMLVGNPDTNWLGAKTSKKPKQGIHRNSAQYVRSTLAC